MMFWFFGALALGFGLLIIVSQALGYVETVRKKTSMSFVPFLGGIFTILGVALIPYESIKPYWWLALILDITMVPMLLLAIWKISAYFVKKLREL